MFPDLKDVVTKALVIDGVGAVLVVAIEQTLQLSLRRRGSIGDQVRCEHARSNDVEADFVWKNLSFL